MSDKLELLPDPGRMVEGLRDTGYQFNTAVADVVDNSIAAGATFVDIQLKMDLAGRLVLTIFDDGEGMNRDALINAMRYGSRRRQSAASLGKFGLGLKTASTAFCRKLVVISRDSATAKLQRATWDLDHVTTANKWELIVDEPTEKEQKAFESVIQGGRGTLVVWEKIDRLLRNYESPTGAHAQKALKKICDNLQEHLSMVYQRFLDASDRRARNVLMRLNQESISPWNPFCVGESILANEATFEVEGSQASFTMRGYILPRKEEFLTPDSAKEARISNQNQGIYIYRENRLIHGPDWLQMFAKEPHLSLLRIEFTFDHQLDDAFQIDIKKSQIILNEGLFEAVTEFLTPLRRAASDGYRKGNKQKINAAGKSAHDSSNNNIRTKEKEIQQPTIDSIDPANNEVELTNKMGPVRLKLKVAAANKPKEVYIQPVDSIDDGLLWEPALIEKHYAVRLNMGHPYYHKIYLPNITEGVTIQGMDALMWGLVVAELNCVSDSTRGLFQELRWDVSKTLRKLVDDLPEPEILNE